MPLDPFDTLLGNLTGLPDVVSVGPTTVQTTVDIIGSAETWIVQVYRQRDQGDTIFLQRVSAGEPVRLMLPPKVAAVIARQYDQLTAKSRSKAARNIQATRTPEDRAKLAARLQSPEVRAKAMKARKAKAAKRAKRKKR